MGPASEAQLCRYYYLYINTVELKLFHYFVKGRRSRRNSSSEDSQLTIENFGGSQDQLNAIDRFDRERERKLSNTTIGKLLQLYIYKIITKAHNQEPRLFIPSL